MREIISIQVGQCGCQTGESLWELLCKEHNINPDGELNINSLQKADNIKNELIYPLVYFNSTSNGNYVPRTIFCDLEPSVIDVIRSGIFKNLFNPVNLISGKEDAADNYCRGMYTIGKLLSDIVLERIRKESEVCDNIQGFNFIHSIGGGTGSGFGSLLQERLSVDYGKKPKISFSIFPSPKISNSIVEPYNAVACIHDLVEHSDSVVVLENEALYDICEKWLNIERPFYYNLNKVVSQVISSLTCSMRFDGALNCTIPEFQTNMVPYPRIKFLLSSFAPLVTPEKAFHELQTIAKITSDSFSPSSMMAKVDPSQGKYLACCLMYRGNAIPKDIYSSVIGFKSSKKVKFVDWCPTGFKIGVTHKPPEVILESGIAKIPCSCALIANNSEIKEAFSKLSQKFDMLYAKRAFVHWLVGEGTESGFFGEIREDLAALEKDYEEVTAISQLNN